MVMNFIRDYEVWNERVTQNLSEDTGGYARYEYAELLNKVF